MGNELSRQILKPEHRRSIKCYIAVSCHLKDALLDVVHDANHGGVPKDPAALYQFFDKNKDKIKKLQKILKQDQIDLLLTQNQRTFSDKWDITLICVVIINFTSLQPPVKGWKVSPPDSTDTSIAAFVLIARSLRNLFNHATWKTFFEEIHFKPFFNETRKVIAGLRYKNIDQFNDLENDLVDQVLFKDDIDEFMNNITAIEKESVITEVLDWLKKENEKGIFFFGSFFFLSYFTFPFFYFPSYPALTG